MAIKQEPFRKYNLEKRNDTFTIWLNSEEREQLEKWKQIIEQPKDSTAFKQLAFIGAKLLGEEKITYMLQVIYANKRKNKRLGIPEFD